MPLRILIITCATPVVIREPPDAPTTNLMVPSLLIAITGAMEDMGRFPGRMKLLGDGGRPKKFVALGCEKSSISLLNMIPVRLPRTLEPKLDKYNKFNVEKDVMDTEIKGKPMLP